MNIIRHSQSQSSALFTGIQLSLLKNQVRTSTRIKKRTLPQQKYDHKDFRAEHKPTFKFENEHEKNYRKNFKLVRAKGESRVEQDIKRMNEDERIYSNSDTARQVSDSKLRSLVDSLSVRGFCREIKPYEPPEDIKSRFESIFAEIALPGQKDAADWLDLPLTDKKFKYQLLTKCWREFDHEITNAFLHRITAVRDVLDYYSTPVRGVNAYESLARQSYDLPPNMYVIPEPIRFHPDSDTMFGGVSAYPQCASYEKGLRAKKKYPTFHANFRWPDI